MNLGELEFTADDLFEGVRKQYVEETTHELAERCAKLVNARLRERLEQAPRVGHTCRNGYSCWHEKGYALWCKPKRWNSHIARLVCIEPVNFSASHLNNLSGGGGV